MLYTPRLEPFTYLAYFDNNIIKKVIISMHQALSDGRFRLVYVHKKHYLIITPSTLWLTDTTESEIQVRSNLDWIII